MTPHAACAPAYTPGGRERIGPVRPGVANGLTIAGFTLHLAVGWPYAFAGLLAPPVGVAILWTIWVALLVAAVLLRSRPIVVFAIPFVAGALWFVVLGVGDAWFGWSA